MAVQWGLGLPQPNAISGFMQGLELGRRYRRENALLAVQQRQVDQQQETREAQVRVGKHIGAGDLSGARVQAAQSGDLDLVTAVNRMTDAQRAEVARQAQVLAPVYDQLSRIPYEQRRAQLDQIAPRLAQMGIPPESIASYDPTDENLQIDRALGRRISNPTSMQQNYEWLRQQNPAAADAYIRRQTEPLPRYVTRPDGSVVMIAPNAGQGDDDEWEYTPPQGGPAPAAGPDTFPGN
jgi:hypothetical protein